MSARISVPNYYLSGNDLVMKLCPKLSFRCLSLSLSVFLKVYEYLDLQLVHSFLPLSALSTYFFERKIHHLLTFFPKCQALRNNLSKNRLFDNFSESSSGNSIFIFTFVRIIKERT